MSTTLPVYIEKLCMLSLVLRASLVNTYEDIQNSDCIQYEARSWKTHGLYIFIILLCMTVMVPLVVVIDQAAEPISCTNLACGHTAYCGYDRLDVFEHHFPCEYAFDMCFICDNFSGLKPYFLFTLEQRPKLRIHKNSLWNKWWKVENKANNNHKMDEQFKAFIGTRSTYSCALVFIFYLFNLKLYIYEYLYKCTLIIAFTVSVLNINICVYLPPTYLITPSRYQWCSQNH